MPVSIQLIELNYSRATYMQPCLLSLQWKTPLIVPLPFLEKLLDLELDNCMASVAQLVRALHRNRRATGSIPAREPIL